MYATNPKTKPYEELVAQGRRALADRTEDGYQTAVMTLDQAVQLQPNAPEAYALRGTAHMELRNWTACAADLEAAADKAKTDEADPKDVVDQRRRLGICLARAGRLADAERVLSEAAASGTGTGEMLMRLGEVRIAMGKLDEAIAALTSALEATDLPSQATTRWLLASAYDRARRPSEALTAARQAAGYDRSFSALVHQQVPLLGVGETEYLLGLAHATNEPPSPEKALVYFRRFTRVAPESPWRKRVDEHLRELESAKLPEQIERRGGTVVVDTDGALRTSIRKAIGPMRACMAKLPASVLEVSITRSGPRSKSPTDPYRSPKPVYPSRLTYRPPAPPPEGVTVALSLNVESVPRAETDAAARCIEPLANKLSLPPVKEKDGWYKVAFFVVSADGTPSR